MATRHVTIVEVGPRDGLQNEQALVSTADKIEFVNRLSAAHLLRYTALVPNLAGLDRAIAAGVTEVAIFASSTETFSRKNINQSIDESLATYAAVCERALAAGLRVRGYLSTAFGCPFEGAVDPRQVAGVAERLAALGVFEVAISDTIGIAHPGQVPRVLEAVLARVPADRIALHYHDTRGTALANVLGVEVHRLEDRPPSPVAPCPSGRGATEVKNEKLKGKSKFQTLTFNF